MHTIIVTDSLGLYYILGVVVNFRKFPFRVGTYTEVKSFSLPHCSKVHNVILEGPNEQIWFQLRGFMETWLASAPTTVLKISTPTTDEMSLKIEKDPYKEGPS